MSKFTGAGEPALHTARENMASRFATSTEQEIERLLKDKDAENTKE